MYDLGQVTGTVIVSVYECPFTAFNIEFTNKSDFS